jgi:hypothetical protein
LGVEKAGLPDHLNHPMGMQTVFNYQVRGTSIEKVWMQQLVQYDQCDKTTIKYLEKY